MKKVSMKKNWDNPRENSMPAVARVPASMEIGGRAGGPGYGVGADGRGDGYGIPPLHPQRQHLYRQRG